MGMVKIFIIIVKIIANEKWKEKNYNRTNENKIIFLHNLIFFCKDSVEMLNYGV